MKHEKIWVDFLFSSKEYLDHTQVLLCILEVDSSVVLVPSSMVQGNLPKIRPRFWNQVGIIIRLELKMELRVGHGTRVEIYQPPTFSGVQYVGYNLRLDKVFPCPDSLLFMFFELTLCHGVVFMVMAHDVGVGGCFIYSLSSFIKPFFFNVPVFSSSLWCC